MMEGISKDDRSLYADDRLTTLKEMMEDSDNTKMFTFRNTSLNKKKIENEDKRGQKYKCKKSNTI